MADNVDTPFLGERINIKTDLGTVTTMVPYLQATASNTLTPLLMGSIPTGANYIDLHLQGGYIPWSSKGGVSVIIYPHIELIHGRVIDISNTPCGAVYFFNVSSNTSEECRYLAIVITNGVLYFANGGSTDNSSNGRLMKGSLYHTGVPERLYISVTFRDK